MPWKTALPLTISPGGIGIKPRIDIMLTDLPQPLSPTTASVSPSPSVNEMPLTA